MKTEKELLLFEQHLYIGANQAYGSSYITGKVFIGKCEMAEFNAGISRLGKKAKNL